QQTLVTIWDLYKKNKGNKFLKCALCELCVRASMVKRFSILVITASVALTGYCQVFRPPLTALRPKANPQHNS
ncbi:hypothetical protein EA848_18150, partial [Vibrio anguillarum]|nr:hypothetical protein [Vibrio anguillarum]MBF4431485.1 hypothetical protein [Vibrio anguillarum]